MSFIMASRIARNRALRTGHTVYLAVWSDGANNDYHWTERQDAPGCTLLLAYIPDDDGEVIVSNKPYDPRCVE